MHRRTFLLFFILLLYSITVTGCQKDSAGSESSTANSEEPPVYAPLQVLVPVSHKKELIGSPPFSVDLSDLSQGYLVALSEDPDTKYHIQLLDPEQITYSYFIQGAAETVIPLSGGDGDYSLTAYEQISGNQYAALFGNTFHVELENPFLPFLYPNQYVNFTPDSKACQLALSLLPEDAEELETLEKIYDYVISHVTYDEEKARTVQAGYLPDIDETLATGKGICFDYASLITAMLRSRDIPCKLQIGYTNELKHAWIDVYIRSIGWVNKVISFDGNTWKRMDPTLASAEGADLTDYIGYGTNYTVQFSR